MLVRGLGDRVAAPQLFVGPTGQKLFCDLALVGRQGVSFFFCCWGGGGWGFKVESRMPDCDRTWLARKDQVM